jgi:hypothetical protein
MDVMPENDFYTTAGYTVDTCSKSLVFVEELIKKGVFFVFLLEPG